MLQCSYILPVMVNIMLMSKLVPHFMPHWHDYYITKVYMYMCVYIYIYIYIYRLYVVIGMSTDQQARDYTD